MPNRYTSTSARSTHLIHLALISKEQLMRLPHSISGFLPRWTKGLRRSNSDGSQSKQRSRSRRDYRARQRYSFLRGETLESRMMLAIVTWDGGGGNLAWNDPLN